MSELLNSDRPGGYGIVTKNEEELNDAHVDLMTLGKKVFGSYSKFVEYLNTESPLYNDKKPIVFLDWFTGVRFIERQINKIEQKTDS